MNFNGEALPNQTTSHADRWFKVMLFGYFYVYAFTALANELYFLATGECLTLHFANGGVQFLTQGMDHKETGGRVVVILAVLLGVGCYQLLNWVSKNRPAPRLSPILAKSGHLPQPQA